MKESDLTKAAFVKRKTTNKTMKVSNPSHFLNKELSVLKLHHAESLPAAVPSSLQCRNHDIFTPLAILR